MVSFPLGFFTVMVPLDSFHFLARSRFSLLEVTVGFLLQDTKNSTADKVRKKYFIL
jgi:hypothetical protein